MEAYLLSNKQFNFALNKAKRDKRSNLSKIQLFII